MNSIIIFILGTTLGLVFGFFSGILYRLEKDDRIKEQYWTIVKNGGNNNDH